MKRSDMLSQDQTFRIIRRLGARPRDFVLDWGRRKEYDKDVVRVWLGGY